MSDTRHERAKRTTFAWACFGAIAYGGCQHQHGANLDAVKCGQVYVNAGAWVYPGPAPTEGGRDE